MGPRSSALGWLVGLFFALAVDAALAQAAPRVVKQVHGYRIALAVESVFEPAQAGADPRHAPALEHRLRVSIHDARTGAAAAMAAVSADVAESGYTGTTVALAPADPRAPGLYEGRIRLRTGPPHRILVHATPPGGGRTLEAQFEYRHHQ